MQTAPVEQVTFGDATSGHEVEACTLVDHRGARLLALRACGDEGAKLIT